MDCETTKQFPAFARNFVDLSCSGENKNGEALRLSALSFMLWRINTRDFAVLTDMLKV